MAWERNKTLAFIGETPACQNRIISAGMTWGPKNPGAEWLMAQSRHRPISFDRRGHGRANNPTWL